MRAEFGAVAGFQRALQKAPENSGFDDGPVAAGGAYQHLQISLAERQRHLFAKQTASERGHVLTQGGAVASARQTAEYGRRAQVKAGCMTTIAFQQRQKTLLADQTNAVGVHRQNALHHEHEDAAIRDRLKRLRWVLQRPIPHRTNQFPKQTRDLVRRRIHRTLRVKAARVVPHLSQTFPDLRISQIFQIDTAALYIWKRRIAPSRSFKVSPQMNGRADVDHHQERRTFRQGCSIVFGLIVRLAHQAAQSRSGVFGPLSSRAIQQGRQLTQVHILACSLLGRQLELHHERAVLEAVDGLVADVALSERPFHRALETVITIPNRVLPRRRDAQHSAEFDDEALAVRPFANRRLAPTRNESLDVHRLSPTGKDYHNASISIVPT